MIVVIADDISGATEIAGICWRFGMITQVQRQFAPGKEIEILVINTNTRSVEEDAARTAIETLAHQISDTNILWCYKKVDSVMRGHVCAELEVLMRTLQKQRAVLAPSNPSKGRTIVNGHYRIDNLPLHETDFVNDPQYPTTSSLVTDLLDVSHRYPILVLKHNTYQGHEKGIIVAEAERLEDLSHWATKVDQNTLAAGSSDFFSAVLEEKTGHKKMKSDSQVVHAVGPKLFVCGSASEYSREAVRNARRLGIKVCAMPNSLLDYATPARSLIDQWVEDVVDALHADDRVVIAIPQPVVKDVQLSNKLSTYMATLVESVIGRSPIRELILEGGVTSEAVLSRLGWTTLKVLGEYGPGVVQLCMSGRENLLVTIKPGSYPWPEEIWNQPKKGESDGQRNRNAGSDS